MTWDCSASALSFMKYNAGRPAIVPQTGRRVWEATGNRMPPHGELWLIRHGETEWSKSGQHTSRTDLPLTPEGEQKAVAVGRLLHGHKFALVLSSPMQRARETARLA